MNMHYNTTEVDVQRRRWRCALFVYWFCGCLVAGPALSQGTVDRIMATGKLTIGYLPDARPFSYSDASGQPAGYAVAVCGKVAEAVKSELKLPIMAVTHVAVPFDERIRAVEQGTIDILCGIEPSLGRRAHLDFTIPVLLNGTGAVIRTDAPVRLREVLSGESPNTQPIWRGSPGQAPERHTVAVIGGTVLERDLIDRLKLSRLVVSVLSVKDNAAGLQMVLDRRADAFFSDRSLLLDSVKRHPSGNRLVVLDRIFKRTQVALGVQRDDSVFRLLVDRALTGLMRSGDMAAIYRAHFGAPDQSILNMFQLVALPD